LNEEEQQELIKKAFFICYNLMKTYDNSVISVKRLRLSIKYILKTLFNLKLTDEQIDDVIRTIPLQTEKYHISYGRPMGYHKGCLKIKNTYYLTVIISWS